MTRVQGYCPMGCGQTLFLGSGDYVTCSWLQCPNPSAVSDLLLEDAKEHQHVVTFTGDGFTIKHPLRERINSELENCELHKYCSAMEGPPVQPGRYRADKTTDEAVNRGAPPWGWTRLKGGAVNEQ